MEDRQPYSLGAWLLPTDEASMMDELYLVAQMYRQSRVDGQVMKRTVMETDWIIVQLIRNS